MRRIDDDLAHIVWSEPGAAFKLALKLVDDPVGTGQGPLLDSLRPERFVQGLFQWFAGLVKIQHGRNAVVQRHLGAGQPDRLQMAVDEIAVAQVEGWRSHYAMHHLLCIVEEPLVMRTECRAVGDD